MFRKCGTVLTINRVCPCFGEATESRDANGVPLAGASLMLDPPLHFVCPEPMLAGPSQHMGGVQLCFLTSGPQP